MGYFLREIYCTTLISTNTIKKYVTFAQREQNYCVTVMFFFIISVLASRVNK